VPIFLDTRGNAVLSIAVCDRCKMKRAHVELSPDNNFPGLMVCFQMAWPEKVLRLKNPALLFPLLFQSLSLGARVGPVYRPRLSHHWPVLHLAFLFLLILLRLSSCRPVFQRLQNASATPTKAFRFRFLMMCAGILLALSIHVSRWIRLRHRIQPNSSPASGFRCSLITSRGCRPAPLMVCLCRVLGAPSSGARDKHNTHRKSRNRNSVFCVVDCQKKTARRRFFWLLICQN